MSLDAPATADALAAVRCAPTILAGVDLMDALMAAASCDATGSVTLLREAINAPGDDLTSIAAVHAAACAGEAVASSLVVPLLTSTVPHLREHAAWALAGAKPIAAATPALRDLQSGGGFTGVLSEATLEAWGMRPRESKDPVADLPTHTALNAGGGSGLTVAQLFLHADIDGTLSNAGQGDTGGIATLLVHLGDALLDEDAIDRVLTLSRGRPERIDGTTHATAGHHYLSLTLPGPVLHASNAWSLRTPLRSEMRRRLLSAGRIDVLHLRMADVGAWVAAEVAQELGISTVLTLAPDPHALIAAREAAGTLTRTTLGAADHTEHLIFRIRLLRDLCAQAAHLVVFPRPALEKDLVDLLHLDADDQRRISVVPEGIDLAPLERAGRQVRDVQGGGTVSSDTASALADLDAVLEQLPAERRALPLAITVGRLHRVKGMASLARAWSSQEALAHRCNLLIVGGNLEDPSDDESEQLRDLDTVLPLASAPGRGLLLAGARPNGTVAVWLAAVRHGRPRLAAPAGIYVSASLKEEFGIAILEAMASGLVVVAPREGGPATYVEDGITGVLTDTSCHDALAAALGTALDMASGPDADEHAERAHDLIENRFSIQTMASALAEIYRKVVRDTSGHQS